MTPVFTATGSGPGETAAVSTFPFFPNRGGGVAGRGGGGRGPRQGSGRVEERACLPGPAAGREGSSLRRWRLSAELLERFLGPSSQLPNEGDVPRGLSPTSSWASPDLPAFPGLPGSHRCSSGAERASVLSRACS